MFLSLGVCVIINLAIGTKLNGLVLGVVNNETSSMSSCLNTSLQTVRVQNYECILQMLSCRFIEELDQSFELVRT
jgi:hypothetical protein